MGQAIALEFLLAGVRDSSGQPLAAGKVYSYEPGTTTAVALYTDQDMQTESTNPVILDARGCAQVYFDGMVKLVIKTSADVTVATYDNLYYGRNDPVWGGYSTGSSNAYAVSLSPAPADYFDGMVVIFKANHTNTDAATLAVSALAAKDLKDADGTALGAGDIEEDVIYQAIYWDAADTFYLVT